MVADTAERTDTDRIKEIGENVEEIKSALLGDLSTIGLIERVRTLENDKIERDKAKDYVKTLVWSSILVPIFTNMAMLFLASRLIVGE